MAPGVALRQDQAFAVLRPGGPIVVDDIDINGGRCQSKFYTPCSGTKGGGYCAEMSLNLGHFAASNCAFFVPRSPRRTVNNGWPRTDRR